MSLQYEKDCKMQMIAVEYAKEYNKLSPPKPVEFLEAFMLQVTTPTRLIFSSNFHPRYYFCT